MSTFEDILGREPFDKIMPLCDNKSFAYFIATTHSTVENFVISIILPFAQKKKDTHIPTYINTNTHKPNTWTETRKMGNKIYNKYQICSACYWNAIEIAWFYCSFWMDAISIILNDSYALCRFLKGFHFDSVIWVSVKFCAVDYAMGFQKRARYFHSPLLTLFSHFADFLYLPRLSWRRYIRFVSNFIGWLNDFQHNLNVIFFFVVVINSFIYNYRARRDHKNIPFIISQTEGNKLLSE